MNENSLLTTLRTRLLAATWSGGSVIFPSGSVYVTTNTDLAMETAIRTARLPICLIQPGTSQSDPEFDEEPGLLRLDVTLRIIALNAGDAVGENVLIGAHKTGGATASEGRGLTEIEEAVYDSIGTLNALESYTIQYRWKSIAGMSVVGTGTMVAWRDYGFEAWVTAT